MDTYFTSRPSSEESFFEFELEYGGETYSWVSAPGIFQRQGLDVGTRLLLDCAAELPGSRVLDLGCGHGVLGLLDLQRRGAAARAWLVDVNARACEASRRNCEKLGLRAWVVHASGADALADASVDLVLTNPPIRAGLPVIRRFWEGAARVLRPEGTLAFVGRPKQGGRRLASLAAEALGGEFEKLGRHKGFEVFSVRR